MRPCISIRGCVRWSVCQSIRPSVGEQGAGPNAEGDNSDAEMAKILNDVEELFGEPVFLTH